MEYSDLVKDFAVRTQSNLNTLQNLQEAHPEIAVFEVTQLVNSLLGLLIFPREKYMERIPRTSLQELEKAGWNIPVTSEGYKKPKDLRHLVCLMRNAVAHCNLEFIAKASSDIEGIKLWNTTMRSPRDRTWEGEISLSELRCFVEKFVAMFRDLDLGNTPT
ncbi:HEPN family nuclease [Oxalobacteraceae bacterium R-40]|uniref:HEPN family nuclease n=1 Tax=Keguizhuia sedimenti TaxID=3064264 RepID=A0ABU1BJ23_9BURK|nr:HEPN family nuclease [Oxalobacteraceae bacterium R-40]